MFADRYATDCGTHFFSKNVNFKNRDSTTTRFLFASIFVHSMVMPSTQHRETGISIFGVGFRRTGLLSSVEIKGFDPQQSAGIAWISWEFCAL